MAAGTDGVHGEPVSLWEPAGRGRGRGCGGVGGGGVNEMTYFVALCRPKEEDAAAPLRLTPGAVLAKVNFTDGR